MCDTIAVFNSSDHSFFAKNSDRDPLEFQFVYISNKPGEEFYDQPFQTKKTEYIENSFQIIKTLFEGYENKYSAVLSKPDWIWGAEMGVNEYGLAIGNEAVFSRGTIVEDGLLGMDILRLALHNTRDANEAVDFIVDIIERHQQGGNGSFSSKLYYNNSFLIKDFNEIFILETSSNKWVVKQVKDLAAISNAYTIRDDYQKNSRDLITNNFKDEYENRLMTYFSKGDSRQQLSFKYLQQNEVNLQSIKDLMRLHRNNSFKMKRGMTSICMHPGFLIKSETTSSMIVEYYQDSFIVWFTASPNPCVSLYKPLLFASDSWGENLFEDISWAYKYSLKWREYSKLMISRYQYFQDKVRTHRDEIESEMEEKMYQIYEGKKSNNLIWEEVLQIAEKYLHDVMRMNL